MSVRENLKGQTDAYFFLCVNWKVNIYCYWKWRKSFLVIEKNIFAPPLIFNIIIFGERNHKF